MSYSLYINSFCAVLSCFSHVWFYVTPWTKASQAPLSTGILQARIQEWVAISFSIHYIIVFIYFFNVYFYFILLYNTVLVLPYIDMNQPRVYMSSQSWTPLPPPIPYHLSGSSPCTSPKHPVSCIEHRLVIRFLPDSIHVSVPFSHIIPHFPSPSPSPSESKSPF